MVWRKLRTVGSGENERRAEWSGGNEGLYGMAETKDCSVWRKLRTVESGGRLP